MREWLNLTERGDPLYLRAADVNGVRITDDQDGAPSVLLYVGSVVYIVDQLPEDVLGQLGVEVSGD